MGKQIAAAIISVLLSFTTWIIPMAATLVGLMAMGDSATVRTPNLGGAMNTAVLLALIAGAISFLSLLYLKLQYGTMVLLALSAVLSCLFSFTQFSIGPALLASVVSVFLTGLVIFGLLQMLNWVYAQTQLTASVMEEF